MSKSIVNLAERILKNPRSSVKLNKGSSFNEDNSKEQATHKCDECGKELKKKKDLRGHNSALHHSCVHSVEAMSRSQI